MKTNSQSTPGPWQSWQTGFDSSTFAVGPNGKTPIAKMLGSNAEINQANARLIAAAPALLEALKRINRTSVKETFHGNVEQFQDWLDGFTTAAIAQAEGRGM